MCWDGMQNRGRGVVLAEAPTGVGDLRGASLHVVWRRYRPLMAIYRRIDGTPTPAPAPALARAHDVETVDVEMVRQVEASLVAFFARSDEDMTYATLSEELGVRTDSAEWPSVLRALNANDDVANGVICFTDSGLALTDPAFGRLQRPWSWAKN